MSPDTTSLSTGVAAAASIVATAYLLRSVRPEARKEGVVNVVEYGGVMKRFVIVFWLFFAGIAVAAAFASERDRLIAFCTAAGFFLAILSMHLEFFHVSIRYDGDGLHTSSPWRRNRFIPWATITGIRFSPALQWYVLSTSGKGRVRLHVYLSGLQSLLRELARHGLATPADALKYK